MTGVFDLYLKTPKEGEVHIPPPSIPTGTIVIPAMDDLEKFDITHKKSVELPQEVLNDLQEWWQKASFADEFIIRCELPV